MDSGSKFLKISDMEKHSNLSMNLEGIPHNLELLITQWHKHVEKKKSGGLRERARQFFEPSYDYDQLSASLSDSVNQLRQDWIFLKMFVESIVRSDAADFLQSKSLSLNIKGVAEEIFTDVCLCANQYEKYYLKRPQEMLSLLGECQRKTDQLSRSEIRVALEGLSRFTIHAQSPDSKFWKRFVPFLGSNLRSFKNTDDGISFLHNELLSIHRYLDGVQKGLSTDVHSDPAIDAFLTHFASVFLRISVQSCSLWFNRTDLEAAKAMATGLVDLHKEIDPTDPEFLQLNLRFQESLYKMNLKRTGVDESASVGHFCDYLLFWVGENGLKMELMSLVTHFFNSTLEDGGEDVHCFFAEIKAVLGEAAFSHRKVLQEATFSRPADNRRNLAAALPPYSELLPKLCLLKVELFLKEQLNSHTPLKALFEVDMILSSLRGFARDLCQQGNTDYVNQSWVLIEEFANEMDSFQKLLHSERITYPLVRHSLLQLLFKIVFFKAESFLTDLCNASDTSIANEDDQIQSLVDELKYFKRIVVNKLVRDSPDEETVIIQIEAIARGITILSYSFLPEYDKFQKMIHSLPQLLDKAKVINAKLGELSQQFPKSIFPKTYELGFMDILVRNIRELLKHDTESIRPVKDHIEEVLLHLESLKSFLVGVKDSDAEHLGELKDLRNHIIEVAYKLEYVVDSIEVDGHLQQSLWLYDLLVDIRLVDQQVSKVHEISYAGNVKTPIQIPFQMLASRDTATEINEMLVDLTDEETALVDRLTRGSKQRDVVSIVGMPGSGKTTLAGKVYNNQNVMCHFYRRAWCTVSLSYVKRELLLEILSHVSVLTDKISQLTDDDLLSKLRRCLLQNRYLIVMDDVWDSEAWNDLKNGFPDDSNGSRILITSRLCDVASEIKSDSNLHFIRPFSDVESWMLLEKKIFKGAACPGKLLGVGMEIAQHCQGLPLAVVAIAGILQRIEKCKDSWEKILKSLSSVIIDNPENRCKQILELSYKHLPEYLKPCFLYLGVFLEEKDIPVNKLMRFWMAEGFIQDIESKSLENIAEDYLLELINRSLVNVSRKRSNGKPKACRLHDLLRNLCHMIAKEENFLQLVSSNDKPYASFPGSNYRAEFYAKNQLAPTSFESYRLSFCLKRRHFIDSRPSGQGVRSLTFFASFDSEPKCPYDISFICHNFKLLRILDLEPVMASDFPVEIGIMVQLTYLAVSGYMQSVPASIANLWRLETLVVKGLRGKVTLPETIWSMESLRHLRVNNQVSFSMENLDEQVGSSRLLQNLVSFSTPSFSCGEDTLNIFKRLPNLRKLRCIFLQSWDFSEDGDGFPVLDFLSHLESLKIIYYGRAISSGEFVLPSNLKKLTLSNFCLQGNHLSTIGKLPNLRILKLLAGAFEEKAWIMEEEDQFMELTFLELDSMRIVEWNASYEHLPSLERLVLRNCEDLEVIPSDFASITTLKTIEVHRCGQSVVVSAEEIKRETEEIEVLITRF